MTAESRSEANKAFHNLNGDPVAANYGLGSADVFDAVERCIHVWPSEANDSDAMARDGEQADLVLCLDAI